MIPTLGNSAAPVPPPAYHQVIMGKGVPQGVGTSWAGTSPRVEASRTRISIICRMAEVVSLPRFWLCQSGVGEADASRFGQTAATAFTVGSHWKRGAR